jgi:hypothetical protein
MTNSKRITRSSSCGSSDSANSSEDGSTGCYSGSRKRSRTSSRASSRASTRATNDSEDDHLDSEDDLEIDYDKIDCRHSDVGSQTSSRKHSRASSNASIRRYSDNEDDIISNNSLDLNRVDEEYERELVTVYRKFGQVVKTTAVSTTPYIKKAFAVSSIYLFWVTLHFVTAQLYVRYCAHPSIYGFLISPFLISAPHCAAMRWVFTKGGTLIDGMWIILGTWLCSKVIYRDA